MPRVFIPQQPMRFDSVSKMNVPTADLSAAFEYGHPVFMLPPGRIRLQKLAKTIAKVEAMMHDFKAEDFLLTTGDPVAISAAVLVAGRHTGGIVQLLRWFPHSSNYKVFTIDTRGNES